MTDTNKVSIKIQIERVVIEGLDIPYSQRAKVQAALEAELGDLLAKGKIGLILQAGGYMPSISTENITLPKELDPISLGRQIARSVYGGLTR